VIFLFIGIAYGIDLSEKNHLRVPSVTNARQNSGRLREGLAVMLSLKGLTPLQHKLLNKALGSFFKDVDEVHRDKLHVLTDRELADIDPNGDLKGIEGLKVYRFQRIALVEALEGINAEPKDIAHITLNLISHPGKFRDDKGAERAVNLFILEEQYNLLSKLDKKVKIQWARHERAHLENIRYSERRILQLYPLDEVIQAIRREVTRRPRPYNIMGFKKAVEIIVDSINRNKILLVGIDGDSRVGKTILSEDILFHIFPEARVCVICIDYYHSLESDIELSGAYWAYTEQYGGISPLQPELESEHWDYKRAARDINDLVESGDFDVIIVEGLNSLYLEILELLGPKKQKFDIKIHLVADTATREHIYKKKFADEPTFDHRRMDSYLERYVQKYPAEGIDYDLVIDNSFTSPFEELGEYLGSEELSNSPDAVAKVTRILKDYSKRERQILLEVGGGSTEIACAIAKNRDDIGVITIDRYDKEGKVYQLEAEDFNNRNLKAQKLQLENLVVVKADEGIFRFLPPFCIDFVLLVSPDFLDRILLARGLRESIKFGGEILVKPWHNFDQSYFFGEPPEEIIYVPEDLKYQGYLFRNTGSSIMFGVDMDAMSGSFSDQPLFKWQKNTIIERSFFSSDLRKDL